MASLYDLELLESNNFIHLFIGNGTSASLQLLRDQKEMAGAMGEIGLKIVHDLDDSTTEIGKTFFRLSNLEKDMQLVMASVGITPKDVEVANTILSKNPISLELLPDGDRSALQGYWIKKKQCIADLTGKGYTYQELFS